MSELLTGQLVIDTAGTAQQGPETPVGNVFGLRPHPDNTGTIWFGDDGEGDVADDTGFPIPTGSGGVVVRCRTLSKFWFDADVNGEAVCWWVIE